MICISISRVDQVIPVLKSGVKLLEFRLDLMETDTGELFARLPEGIGTVATFRPGTVAEKFRVQKLAEAIRLGADMVDIELEAPRSSVDILREQASMHDCEVIFSHHDFSATPDKKTLEEILKRCYHSGGEIAKIATRVRDRNDVINLLSLYQLPGRKVVLGMGELGRITRVVGPYLGAEFTFASPGEGAETAPGQIGLKQLQEINRLIDAS
jgi:3-dehydroquinate dehydratase-1